MVQMAHAAWELDKNQKLNKQDIPIPAKILSTKNSRI